mmetsp:Transcript_3106/g.4642  ORF Transcript_3106/g.4642 Transcript_3106/m.4642 type:complete len:89 (+) Transcript_3106:101-367(+)
MFAYFANKERRGEPLATLKHSEEFFNRKGTTPVTSFWYTPLKKSEKYNVQCRQLVHELAKVEDPLEIASPSSAGGTDRKEENKSEIKK